MKQLRKILRNLKNALKLASLNLPTRRQRPTDNLIHLLGDICSNATLANAVEVKPWLILYGAFVSDQQSQT